jgi:hypothetical protein
MGLQPFEGKHISFLLDEVMEDFFCPLDGDLM